MAAFATPGRRFDQRCALIAGAGGPMGTATAVRLGLEGARLVLVDISERRLANAVDQLRIAVPGADLFPRRADVLAAGEVAEVAEQLDENHQPDVIVNIVGGFGEASCRCASSPSMKSGGTRRLVCDRRRPPCLRRDPGRPVAQAGSGPTLLGNAVCAAIEATAGGGRALGQARECCTRIGSPPPEVAAAH